MSNAPAILRSLVIYAVCVPLAIVVGYMVTNPMDYSNLGVFGILALVLATPLLMRWHYPLLILSLQMTVSLFFIKGSPSLWLVMTVISLGISVLERTMNSERHFIRVPQITWPLMCLTGVVLLTAKLTGGFGLRAFDSEVYGGKKYVYIIVGVLLYFALSARRIPPERAKLFVTLYFFGGLLSFIGDLYPVTPSWAHFIFWLFPPSYNLFYDTGSPYELGVTRLGGFGFTGLSLCFVLVARYGIRGIFLSGKLWLLAVFCLAVSMTFLGGYRAALLTVALVFVIQFFLEGLHRTKLLPLFGFFGVIAFVILISVAPRLPFTVQRTLAFLPLPLDHQARESAQDTMDWRIQMWTALLPQVPQYLLLGKGLAISPEDFTEMMSAGLGVTAGQLDPSQNSSALAYDYHNGTLAVLIPFGIWGALTFLWFVIAGLWVMHRNLRYGDPALQSVNIFLFAYFFVAFVFYFIGGSLNSDMMKFGALLGLSVAINGGVCRRPVPQPVSATETFFQSRGSLTRPQPHPAFPR